MIQHILQDAIKYARAQFPLKADNKVYPEHHPKKFKRVHTSYMDRIKPIRQDYLREELEDLQPYEEYKYIKKHNEDRDPLELCGNCHELCTVAFYYLVNNYIELVKHYSTHVDIHFIEIADQHDHAFLMVGQYLSWDRQLPASWGGYLPSAWVCDPWANIVCPANYFPFEWEAKMLKWHHAGKKLRIEALNHVTRRYEVKLVSPYEDLISVSTVRQGRLSVRFSNKVEQLAPLRDEHSFFISRQEHT